MPKRNPRPRATGDPSDVTDEEWALVAPDLTLSRLDSPQRTYDLRTVFNAIRAPAPRRKHFNNNSRRT